jgi:hypothetical protein
VNLIIISVIFKNKDKDCTLMKFRRIKGSIKRTLKNKTLKETCFSYGLEVGIWTVE